MTTWKKLTFEKFTNPNEKNKIMINSSKQFFEEIINLLKQLQTHIFSFENDVTNLITKINNEGFNKTNVIYYNSLIYQFMNSIKIYLEKKSNFQNKNQFLIKKWNEKCNFVEYNIHLEINDANYKSDIKLCIVDNISILFPVFIKGTLCPINNDNGMMHIGKSIIQFPFISENIDEKNFINILLEILIKNLNKLCYIIQGNIKIINTCIENIDEQISEYINIVDA